MTRRVNNKNIIIGKQNFDSNTIDVIEENGNTVNCPMYQDTEGNIYFIYNNMGVYVSDWLGNFML